MRFDRTQCLYNPLFTLTLARRQTPFSLFKQLYTCAMEPCQFNLELRNRRTLKIRQREFFFFFFFFFPPTPPLSTDHGLKANTSTTPKNPPLSSYYYLAIPPDHVTCIRNNYVTSQGSVRNYVLQPVRPGYSRDP